jgi:carbon-monoxide dehydrogenase medium subunit
MASPLPKKQYLRPKSLQEAQAALQHAGSQALAGGTQLLTYDNAATTLVDLQDLALTSINISADGTLALGAMATLQQIADQLRPSHQHAHQLLVEAIQREAPRQVRQSATIGGTVATAKATSEVFASLLVLEATVELADGQRVPLEQYETGLIITVHVPGTAASVGTARVARTPRDEPIVLVIAVAEASSEAETAPAAEMPAPEESTGFDEDELPVAAPTPYRGRIRLVAAADPTKRAIRLPEAEAGLAGLSIEETVARVGQLAAKEVHPGSDFRGSGEYRREMVRTLSRRALAEALREASHPEEHQHGD